MNAAANELLAKQDRARQIEAEIMALTEVLNEMPGKPGLKGKLIDREGFPRADVDIHQVRIHRNRIACLQTDHVGIMKEIEQGMFALHQATKGGSVAVQTLEKEPQGPGPTTSRQPMAATSAPAAATAATAAAPVVAAAAVPFALIDQVSEQSPASRAGLRVGDRLIRMGDVEADDIATQGMSVLAGVVRNHEGRPLAVAVLSDNGEVRNLRLTPATWEGQGLLGCHLTPI